MTPFCKGHGDSRQLPSAEPRSSKASWRTSNGISASSVSGFMTSRQVGRAATATQGGRDCPGKPNVLDPFWSVNVDPFLFVNPSLFPGVVPGFSGKSALLEVNT